MIKDETQYSEDTLFKVYDALKELGLKHQQIIDAVFAIQNKGILFRERVESKASDCADM